MTKDELESKCKVFASTSANYAGDYASVSALEAFAKEMMVKTWEEAKVLVEASEGDYDFILFKLKTQITQLQKGGEADV